MALVKVFSFRSQQLLGSSEISPYHPHRHLTIRLFLCNLSVFRGVVYVLFHFFFPIHHFESNLCHKPAVYLLHSDDQHKNLLSSYFLKSFLLSF